MSAAPNATGADRANDHPRQDQTTNTTIVSDLDALRKSIATLTAHLALKGFSLHELADGSYLVARWDRTLHCPDLHAVRAFCHRVGVSI